MRKVTLTGLAALMLGAACAEPPEVEGVPTETSRAGLGTYVRLLVARQSGLDIGNTTLPLGLTGTVRVHTGHTIIVAGSAGPAGAVSCSDTKGNVYTVDVQAGGTSYEDSLTFICSTYVTNELTQADTITVNYPSFDGVSVAVANEFAGLTTLDQIAAATGNGNAPTSGFSGTTAVADELLFAAIGINENRTLNAGTGYVIAGDFGGGSGLDRRVLTPEYRFVSATGSYQGNGTIRRGFVSPWRAVLATYRVDITAPTVAIVSTSPNPTDAGTTLTWSANEAGTFEVRVNATSCSDGTLVDSGDYLTGGTSQATVIDTSELLGGSNDLRVCVTDSGTNVGFATTTVVKDLTAPTVVIDSVAPNPTSVDVVVTFHANENGPYSLRVGGGTCAAGTVVASGTYSGSPATAQATIPLGSLVEGPNALRLCVTDDFGNQGFATSSVARDGSPPSVTIDGLSPSPTSGGTNLTWHASEDGAFSVRVGSTSCTDGIIVDSGAYMGAPATVVSTISSSNLGEGTNGLRVCVTDNVSNLGTSTTTVFKDSTAPAVVIDSLAPSPTAAGTTLTWRANENGSFSVRVGGTDCSSGVAIDSGTYTAPAPRATVIDTSDLSEGPNVLRVCVTDALINTGSQNVTVTKDTTSPVVMIVGVSPNPTSSGTTITWNGSESGTFEVRVGGADCGTGVVVASGAYTGAPANRMTSIAAGDLGQGSNVLRVCLVDATANVGSVSSSVTVDSAAPAVTIVDVSPDPTPDSTTITWQATENGTFSVRVGGTTCASGTLADSGTYSTAPAQVVSVIAAGDLPNGVSTLRVCVVDSAGNSGSATDSVIKDSSPPLVALACMPQTSGAGVVRFTANQSGTYSVRVDASDCTDGVEVATGPYAAPGELEATVPAADLVEGPNTIVVCLTNSLGLEGQDQGNLTFRAPSLVDLATESAERTLVGGTLAGELGAMSIGDVTGDGIADLVAAERPGRGASGAIIRRNAGTAYVYEGGATFLSGATTVVPTGARFQVTGGDAYDDLGVRNNGGIRAGVDVTGDGLGDLVISAGGADGVDNTRLDAGEIYVLAGGSALTGAVDLTGPALPAAVFSRIIGPAPSGFAQILAVGDVNGDGVSDLLIGVPLADPSGRTDAGEAFLVAGGPSLAGTIDLASASVLARFAGGSAGDGLGGAGAIGDFGGTSDVDVLLGAPNRSASRGAAYGVFGPIAGIHDLGAGDEDIRWQSDFAARLGMGVAIANVTGSPALDVVLSGRRLSDASGVAVGGVVVFEGRIAAGSPIVVANPGSYGGATSAIVGEDLDDNLGAAFSHGDLDGDGYDDLVLGAYRSDGPDELREGAGSGVVVLGGQCMVPRIDLGSVVPSYIVHGPRAGGNLGRFASSVAVGDLNDDFVNDFCLASSIGATGELSCFSAPW